MFAFDWHKIVALLHVLLGWAGLKERQEKGTAI